MKMVTAAGAEEKKKSQGELQAVWFAAGTAAFMACLERAILVSFIEQWRVVVFLALNLLLLGILFTSPPSSPPPTSTEDLEFDVIEPPTDNHPDCQEKRVDLIENEEMIKKMKQFCSRKDEQPEEVEIGVDNGSHCARPKGVVVKSRVNRKREISHRNVVRVSDSKAHELSKEEFNQKVEAFIATFRQHLVSDAMGTKSCRLHSSPAGNFNRQYPGIAMRF
ncbi:OLC1v1009439C1 [Oldenlandia corymbosa var. corymbosa]|uniref:OLC1v1009439C1 n=1 Tax=Oldenlandia corymbosa var. corymbosa TaxID=529605 RepID=A0AAV1DNY2_OLDCO|nr:OLC1v1009439C1 [Oldenlandia corymbosa var. corymbosa]